MVTENGTCTGGKSPCSAFASFCCGAYTPASARAQGRYLLRRTGQVQAAELLRQLGQPLGRQTAGCHLLRGFGQAVGFVDDQRLVVPQQWFPSVLAVESIGQQIVMVADLDRDRWPVGFAQVLLVAAAFPLGAAAVTVRWHADVPAVIAGQPRHMVKVQAAAGFAQQRSPVGKPLATLGELQPPLLQTQVAGEPFLCPLRSTARMGVSIYPFCIKARERNGMYSFKIASCSATLAVEITTGERSGRGRCSCHRMQATR